MIEPMVNAKTGDKNKALNISAVPAPLKLLIPAPEITAPGKAPIKACEEDDGIPYHQVITFQAIAPISALITIGIPCSSVAGSATPPPIILATPVKATAPTKFITAANATATLG